MAFNWQTFRTRTITSIVFVAVMLVGLLWNKWSFLVLFSVIHFGCWWEYLRLTEKIHNNSFHPYLKWGLMLMGYGLLTWCCGPSYHINGYGLKQNLSFPLTVAGFTLLIIGMFRQKNVQLKQFGMAIAGWAYISLSLGLMINLYMAGCSISCMNGGGITGIASNHSYILFPFIIIPLIIIISLWINDTMAYITGSLIGKTPLTKISPKKTWEGTIGGILLSIVITGLIFSNLDPSIAIPGYKYNFSASYHWYILAGIASIAGIGGDLFESKLKRMAGVKDSGSFMPGHGGFLDRFDSMLLAIPFVWLYVQFMLK